MSMPHPSCTLVIDLDESLVDDETRLEIKRCYAHVGSCAIRSHCAAPDMFNVMNLIAHFGMRHYLRSRDEGSDRLWKDVMEKWFYNEFRKVGNNMVIYNRRQEELGRPELFFDYLDVDLENGDLHVRMHLDSNSTIEPSDSKWLTLARSCLNSGKLGFGVTCIEMPSKKSYDDQCEAGLAAQAEKAKLEQAAQAERAAREEALEKQAEDEADARFLEQPRQSEWDKIAARHAERMSKLEERYGKRDADFTIDYHIWDLHYSDGTTRTYDSETGQCG